MHSHQGPGTETNQGKGKKIILPKDTSVLQGSLADGYRVGEKVCVGVCGEGGYIGGTQTQTRP